MKIFISWSGSTSKRIAEVLREWIPKVIQSAEPFLSSKDIPSGSRWLDKLNRELSETSIGIIILTKSTVKAPWLLFEAGALSKEFSSSRVIPILFGINKDEVNGPLSQFQILESTNQDFIKLFKEINSISSKKINDEIITDLVDTYWYRIQRQIESALQTKDRPDPVVETINSLPLIRETFNKLAVELSWIVPSREVRVYNTSNIIEYDRERGHIVFTHPIAPPGSSNYVKHIMLKDLSSSEKIINVTFYLIQKVSPMHLYHFFELLNNLSLECFKKPLTKILEQHDNLDWSKITPETTSFLR